MPPNSSDSKIVRTRDQSDLLPSISQNENSKAHTPFTMLFYPFTEKRMKGRSTKMKWNGF